MPNPTRLEAKNRLAPQMTAGFEFDYGLQELIERAYDQIEFPGSRAELSFDAALDLHQSGEDYYIRINPDEYASIIKFRCGHKGFGVINIGALYQNSGLAATNFIDRGEAEIEDVLYRMYQVPPGLASATDPIYGYAKVMPPVIEDDSDILPFKTIGVIKLGLLAIGYENENDDKRALTYWQQFRFELEKAAQRHDGVKQTRIIWKEGYTRQPTNFQ